MEKRINEEKRNVVVIGPRKSGKRSIINKILPLFCGSKRDQTTYDKLLTDLDNSNAVDPFLISISTKKYWFYIDHLIGHRRFVRSLAKQPGPTVAFLVVSAVAEEFDQSCQEMIEQLELISNFGIKDVIVLVTKMDLIHYDSARFSEIETIIETERLKRLMRFKFVKYVPVSGTSDLNLASKSNLTEWYTGPAFIDLIDTIPYLIREEELPTRFSIEEVFKIAGIGYIGCGRLSTGVLTSGDQIIIAPENWSTTVKAIENHHDELTVTAGTHIGLDVAIYGKDLRKGHVIGVRYNNPPKAVLQFTAFLYINKLPNLFVVDHIHSVKCHHALVNCKIIELIGKADHNYGAVTKLTNQKIDSNEYVVIRFEPVEPLCLELYSEYKSFGQIILQDNDGLIASGIVTSVINDEKPVQKK